LDLSFVVKKYLDRIRPELIILNELEVWPNWVRMAKKRGIRILLINGRISRRAFRMYRLFRWLLASTFRRIDRYLIQSDFYRDKFRQLRIPESKITVTGNIKADQAAALREKLPLSGSILQQLKTIRPRKKILVAASTHPGDEKVLIPILSKLTPRFALIMVPRHPGRAAMLQAILDQRKIPAVTWSSADQVDLDRQVLIYDRIGLLFEIMSIGDRVIMGGTYEEKVGGHNLYEPLALEKPLFGGPCYNNFPDIGAALVKQRVYRICTDSPELAECLLNFRESATLVKTARRIFDSRTGSVEWTLQEIKKSLS
jgi:3-deoxy-D-manno-octulosonic-acid transferase